MTTKKVLILITKSNWGGAQRHVYDLATSLPKDAYAVEVMAGGQPGGQAGEGPLITHLIEAGIAASGTIPIGRDVSIWRDVIAFFKLWSILRRKRPDILHVHSSKIGGLGALAGRCARVPHIVFTAHGWAFNEDRSLPSKMLIRLSYWVILSLSHHTIIISEAMRQQIKNWPFISKKISIIHNGIKSASLYSQANARHALYAIFPQLKKIAESVGDKNLFWVGSIAELHHIKGFEYAIRAIRHCITEIKNSYPQKTVIFTVFGEGEERQYLENLIRQMQLEDHVFLLGHTADAAQYVPALDVFMLSSLSEGLGYVLLEAGLAHAPVVATAVGGIPEIIRDMNSGILVQSRNPQELAHALVFMLDHPAERKQYGNALKERVTSQFTLEKMLEGVIKAYKKE